jgi:membrane-bound metal-dependent hydrolase YbcI (DUF457 family)
MLSRDHVVLSIFSCFILFGWLFFQTPIFFIAIAFGVFIGCLLPDTDLPKSKIDHMKGIPGFLGMITKIILNPLIAMIFEFLLKKPIDRSHRGVTHTIYGILTYCLIIEGVSIPILIVIGLSGFIAGYSLFVFGLFFGGILHLMEDSCTKSGILPFYPINENRKYSGNISTYDLNEMRPKLYALFLLVVSVFLLIIHIYSGFPFGVYIFLSVASFIIVWKIIITISKK